MRFDHDATTRSTPTVAASLERITPEAVPDDGTRPGAPTTRRERSHR